MRSSIHNDNSLDYQYYVPINIDNYFELDKWFDLDNYLNNKVSPALDQGDERDDEMINYISKNKTISERQHLRSLG